MKHSVLSPAALLVLFAGSASTAFSQSIEPFPAQFELSSLLPANGGTGADGFVLNGVDVRDYSGLSVSSAGDVNGDGIDDLIIGAASADPNGNGNAGESYVVFGGVGVGSSGVVELSSLNGANGFALNGIDAYDFSGVSVSSAGDVNGDGFADLLIGANRAGPSQYSSEGESYVVFGAADLGTGGVGAGGSFNLSALNGANGFVLNGIDALDRSGGSVSSAGDVNGDGFDDIIIGADRASLGRFSFVGESYVVFGAADLGTGGVGAGGSFNLSSLNGANGFVLNGIDDDDRSGTLVSSAGDVNGDGMDDLLVGASAADPNGNTNAGESYVVFGAQGIGAGGVLSLSSLNGTNGFVLNGIDTGDQSGQSASSAGDVNGDGIDDLIIGAERADPGGDYSAGESYVVFGAPGVGAGGSFNLSSLNGANGFVFNGIDAQDCSGGSVSSAGDVNGDGIDDLIIGALVASPNGILVAGESYVVFGAADLGVGGVGTGGSFELSALNGANGFVLSGIDEADFSGSSVSSAGDVNDDGIDDLIIGAHLGDANGIMDAGESYLVFGRDLAPCPADLNGDGITDFGDIDVFIDLFLVQDLGADFNGDGIIDFGDINTFIPLFLDGC